MPNIVQEKRLPTWDRHQYYMHPRYPVRLVAWNNKESNLGGAIRTAEAFRIEHVYLLRRPKSLAGAVKQHHWQPTTYTSDLVAAIEQAKADGYTIVALEQTNQSAPLPTANLPERMCLVAGDEGIGVPPKALELCDLAVEIPQYGMVGSLNVVTAISIALYEWTRQHARKG